MDGISAINNVLTSALDANLHQATKMTTAAVAAAVSGGADQTRAEAMQMFGIGGNIDASA